jgi:hypothetical protein
MTVISMNTIRRVSCDGDAIVADMASHCLVVDPVVTRLETLRKGQLSASDQAETEDAFARCVWIFEPEPAH